jgi:hypothetical protein
MMLVEKKFLVEIDFFPPSGFPPGGYSNKWQALGGYMPAISL